MHLLLQRGSQLDEIAAASEQIIYMVSKTKVNQITSNTQICLYFIIYINSLATIIIIFNQRHLFNLTLSFLYLK